MKVEGSTQAPPERRATKKKVGRPPKVGGKGELLIECTAWLPGETAERFVIKTDHVGHKRSLTLRKLKAVLLQGMQHAYGSRIRIK